MTAVVDSQRTGALRRAAVRATRAPSVHNTQPWRFVVSGSALEIYADPERRLHVLDPRGRQLMLSCGCALFNARVALADTGVRVERLPELVEANGVARVVLDAHAAPDAALSELDPAIDLRQTNRRAFSDDPVPAALVDVLCNAARQEGASLEPVVHSDDRLAVARLTQLADRHELTDPAYRAELRAWTSNDPSRLDGVPATAVPHVDAGCEDDVPIRDFDTHGTGKLPTNTRSSLQQCLLLLGTNEDNPMSWLRAGEALERVLLEIARCGYAASPFTQAIEVAQTNALLRHELRLQMFPHVLLRVGQAPPTPETRRRRLVDVINQVD